ncbi:MAG: endonuclease [Weeksellaceae bacterium]
MRFISCLFFLACITISAQIPTYYDGIDFSQDKNMLQAELNTLLEKTHTTRLSYTPGVWNALREIDSDTENTDKLLLIYGSDDFDDELMNDRTRDKALSCHRTQCTGRWNREHVYPKSIGEFKDDGYEITDIHAIRASDTEMNEYRFNSPFVDGSEVAGEVSSYRFYPGDEWKGDIARMILYMYLRYPNNCKPNYVGIDEHTYDKNIPDIFLEWNAEDPVSEFETIRNNLIAQNYQGNRNPFINNPYLATYLWGGPKAEDKWGTLSANQVEDKQFMIYPNPSSDLIYYNNINFTQITIYDIDGRLVGQDRDVSNNFTQLPENKGVYMVEFCNEKTCYTVKVIKK